MQRVGTEGILILEQGCVAYGPTAVLQVDHFAISAGCAALIRGGNGTGKTSLFHAIVGLTARFTGRIVYLGHPLSSMPAHRRAAAGIRLVPQDRHVFHRLTAHQHLLLAARHLSDSRRSAATETPTGVSSPGLLERDQLASQFSGGEAKMLLLGAVTVGYVRLLILDELYAGLDPAAAEHATKIVEQCLASGTACIFADHANIAAQKFPNIVPYTITPSEKPKVPFILRECSK